MTKRYLDYQQEEESEQQELDKWTLVKRGVAEFCLVSVLFMIYFTTRGLVTGRETDAFLNAYDVIRLERSLGIFWELQFQAWVLSNDLIIRIVNYVYMYTHLPGLILFAIWAFIWHHDRYPQMRNVFLGMLAMGLAVYSLYPLAPPRFFIQTGFIDTLAEFSALDYHEPSIAMLYNPYAAMPSLHVGFSVFVAIGLVILGRRWYHWAIAFTYPTLMSLAVVGTGNHFILDIVGGIAVAVGAHVLIPPIVTKVRKILRSHRRKELTSPRTA